MMHRRAIAMGLFWEVQRWCRVPSKACKCLISLSHSSLYKREVSREEKNGGNVVNQENKPAMD